MNEQAKVHIVDDDEAIRQALLFLMKSEGLPTRIYASAEEFLSALSPATQGCLVLDVRMPGLTGLQVQERLKQKNSSLPVIVMTGYGDVAMAVKAMKAGAVDFIEKPFNNAELLQLVYSCLSYQETMEHDRHNREEGVRRLERLTKREREVMDLLVQGNQNKVIASKLGISPRTVELHRARVMEKLEARSVSDVVRIALTASAQDFAAL